jgi:hypothetical protein
LVNKMLVYEMSVNEILVDKMSVDEICIGWWNVGRRMLVDEMSVDEMSGHELKLSSMPHTFHIG